MVKSMWAPKHDTFKCDYSTSHSKPCVLICCFDSLHSSGKTVQQISKSGCRDFLPLSHKSISKDRHWCWAIINADYQYLIWTPSSLPFHTTDTFLIGSLVKTHHWSSERWPGLEPQWFLCWTGRSHGPGTTLSAVLDQTTLFSMCPPNRRKRNIRFYYNNCTYLPTNREWYLLIGLQKNVSEEIVMNKVEHHTSNMTILPLKTAIKCLGSLAIVILTWTGSPPYFWSKSTAWNAEAATSSCVAWRPLKSKW